MTRRLPWIAIGFLLALIALAIAAPFLPLPPPTRMAVAQRMAGPSLAHWLGQDEYGRDVLSRLIWGARASLTVAAASTLIACVIGTALGILGGFMRGIVEMLALRSIDILLCFPPLLLALLVVTLAGPGTATLIPVLAIVFIPGFTRVAYAGVLTVRSADYVEAMRVAGAGRGWIMLRTILPNIGGPVLVQLSLAVAAAIVLESGLSFLGLGVVPPAPSWGLMIGAARATMAQSPLLLLWPCLVLTATILIMNFLCDGLRDAVDPHPVPPRSREMPPPPATQPGSAATDLVLDVRGLTVEIEAGGLTIRPVRDVTLQVAPGETVAIVGESGSGKSVTSLAITGLLPGSARAVAGAACLDGVDLLQLSEEEKRKLRGRDIAMIFQDPASSLNPVHTVGAQIVETILAHRPVSRSTAWAEAVRLLARVGIPDPERRARAYPHEMSGGMRQRVMIAIAIANKPKLLIADEPTTALDVTVQAQVLELLAELRREEGLAMLFITHSLPVVAEIANRVVVMYRGEVVESGPTAEVFARPLHPYTRALRDAAPEEDGPEAEPSAPQADGVEPMALGGMTRPATPDEISEPLVEVQPGRFVRGAGLRKAA
ncbi:MAG TPA: dipeptide/oligopeptide/nickel ABC transporter permease/ATP-binding protein [Geminicoccus sp.]|nr:dipeptide/oligopeptide/nickel ABC transporter permease/ATP-binding protein [Geminicoccus sp.]